MTFGGVNPNRYVGPINYYPILSPNRNLLLTGFQPYMSVKLNCKIKNMSIKIKSLKFFIVFKAISLIILSSATLFSANYFWTNQLLSNFAGVQKFN